MPSAWLRFALAAPQLASTDPVGLCECACLEVSQLIVRGPTAAWRSCSMASMVSSPEGRPRAPKRWLWTRPSCSRAALAARSAWPTTSAGSCILANCMHGRHVLSTYLLSDCLVAVTATHTRYLDSNHLACRHACSRGDGLGSHSIRAINVTKPDCPSSANVLAVTREVHTPGKQASSEVEEWASVWALLVLCCTYTSTMSTSSSVKEGTRSDSTSPKAPRICPVHQQSVSEK